MEAPVHFERDTDGNGIACKIGGKRFARNFFPGEGNKVFRVEVAGDYQSLKDAALRADMPVKLQQGTAGKLVRIRSVIPNVKFDLRYAGNNNIFGVPLYNAGEAFADAETAAALKKGVCGGRNGRCVEKSIGSACRERVRPFGVGSLPTLVCFQTGCGSAA